MMDGERSFRCFSAVRPLFFKQIFFILFFVRKEKYTKETLSCDNNREIQAYLMEGFQEAFHFLLLEPSMPCSKPRISSDSYRAETPDTEQEKSGIIQPL